MKTEEAAQWLEQYVDNDCYTTNFQEVCKMAISALRAQQEAEKPKWISVEDWLPEDWVDVLVLLHCGNCVVAVKSGHIWRERWTHMLVDEITHWMPLPEPPKED